MGGTERYGKMFETAQYPTLKFRKIEEDAIIPKKAHESDAGMDVCSTHNQLIKPNEMQVIHTGLTCEIPKGFELQVRPRSGLAMKHHILDTSNF